MENTIKNHILKSYDDRPRTWWKQLLITLAVAMILIWSSSSIDFKGIAAKGSEVALGIFNGIFNPDTNLLFDMSDSGVIPLLGETMAIALLGTLFGGMLAIPFSFLSATNIVPKPVALFFRTFILLIRTIPSLVWALIWIRVTGPGAMCGVVTQSVCSIGMISKMYITAIEDIDTRILESLDASGCTTFQKIRYGIMPQLFANMMSTVIYRFDINIKDASTLGIVGAGGIGQELKNSVDLLDFPRVFGIILLILAMVTVIDQVSAWLRSRLS